MKKKLNGCVYFFRHLTTEPIKIGYSVKPTPKSRFSQFKTYAPFGAELLGFIRSEDPLSLERELHKKYSDKRLNGEWFNISVSDVKKDIETYTKYQEKIRESNYKIKYMDYLEDMLTESDLKINSDLIKFLDDINFRKLKIQRKDLKLNFLNKYPKNKNEITSQKFNKQIKIYAEYYGIKIIEKSINGFIHFISV